jgi:hypothetical protein
MTDADNKSARAQMFPSPPPSSRMEDKLTDRLLPNCYEINETFSHFPDSDNKNGHRVGLFMLYQHLADSGLLSPENPEYRLKVLQHLLCNDSFHGKPFISDLLADNVKSIHIPVKINFAYTQLRKK